MDFDAHNLTIACYFLKYRLAFGFISFKVPKTSHECRTTLVGVFSTNRCVLFGHSGLIIILRNNKIAHLDRSSEGSFSLSKTALE